MSRKKRKGSGPNDVHLVGDAPGPDPFAGGARPELLIPNENGGYTVIPAGPTMTLLNGRIKPHQDGGSIFDKWAIESYTNSHPTAWLKHGAEGMARSAVAHPMELGSEHAYEAAQFLKRPSIFSHRGGGEIPPQKKVEKVMHEFKQGKLKSGGSGNKVTDRKQAIAIAMSEAGISKHADGGEIIPPDTSTWSGWLRSMNPFATVSDALSTSNAQVQNQQQVQQRRTEGVPVSVPYKSPPNPPDVIPHAKGGTIRCHQEGGTIQSPSLLEKETGGNIYTEPEIQPGARGIPDSAIDNLRGSFDSRTADAMTFGGAAPVAAQPQPEAPKPTPANVITGRRIPTEPTYTPPLTPGNAYQVLGRTPSGGFNQEVINGTQRSIMSYGPNGGIPQETVLTLGDRPSAGKVATWNAQEEEKKRQGKIQEEFVKASTREPNKLDFDMAASRVGTPQEMPGDKEKKAALEYGARLSGEIPSLQDMTPERVKEAQKYADKLKAGDAQWPPGYLLARDKTGVWNAALQLAMDQEPSLSQITYPTRQATRKYFTTGLGARNITSINTLVGHFDSLSKAADGLGNTWSPTVNYLGNMMRTGTGDPRVTKFNVALGAVANELATVFKNSGVSSLEEIRSWREKINSSQSPAQLREAIKMGIDLMGSRLRELSNRYQEGMGTSQKLTILSPKSREVLGRIVGNDVVNDLEPPSEGGGKTESNANPTAKTVVKTGTHNGRKVVQYSDGTIDYAD